MGVVLPRASCPWNLVFEVGRYAVGRKFSWQKYTDAEHWPTPHTPVSVDYVHTTSPPSPWVVKLRVEAIAIPTTHCCGTSAPCTWACLTCNSTPLRICYTPWWPTAPTWPNLHKSTFLIWPFWYHVKTSTTQWWCTKSSQRVVEHNKVCTDANQVRCVWIAYTNPVQYLLQVH